MPSRTRRHGRTMTRLAVVLLAAGGLATGCSGQEAAPVPTQLALLGPFEHFGMLTGDLTVTLVTNEMEQITLWPQAPGA